MYVKKLLIMLCAASLTLPLFSACDEGDDGGSSGSAIYVAYIADQDTDEIGELYVANPGSAESGTKVSGTMIAAGDVTTAKWSPNRSKIAFTADKDTDGVFELYVVAANGSNLVKVNSAMVTGGDISTYKWSPNSSWIAYRADEDTDGLVELYVADPGTAASSIKVSDGVINGVNDFEWSPNSSWIAYIADEDLSGQYELYTVNRTGTTRYNTSISLIAAGDVSTFAWAPNSSRIAYIADDTTDGVTEVHIADYNGANPNQASALGTTNGTAVDLQWSPDSSMLAYRADEETLNVYELYVVTSAGLERKKVNPSPAGDVLNDYQWSPDSSMLAFRADLDIAGDFELFVSYVDTFNSSDEYFGTMYRMNDDLPTGGDITYVYAPAFQWAPDSSRIAYTGDLEIAGEVQLEVVDNDATNRVRLNNTLPDAADVLIFTWLPNGSRIIYIADQDIDGVSELYSIKPDGSERVKLSGSIIANTTFDPLGDVWYTYWGVLPDSSRVVYCADQDDDEIWELYSVRPDGTGRIRLNPDLTGTQDVWYTYIPE